MNKISWMFPALALAFVGSAFAAPVQCSSGYQDASCASPLMRAAQSPPTCSSAAGWQTVSPAKWIGSQYSQPTCSFTEQPTCGANTYQTAAPSWNGSSWVGLTCAPIPSAPTCGANMMQTSAPTWNGSSWVGLMCAAIPAAPTCGANMMQTSAPTWNGSWWVGLTCAAIPAAPTCGANMTQTAAPTWNGSAWVGLMCTPVQAPSCPSGETWNGSVCVVTYLYVYQITGSLTYNGQSVGQVIEIPVTDSPNKKALGSRTAVSSFWPGTVWTYGDGNFYANAIVWGNGSSSDYSAGGLHAGFGWYDSGKLDAGKSWMASKGCVSASGWTLRGDYANYSIYGEEIQSLSDGSETGNGGGVSFVLSVACKARQSISGITAR